MTWEPPPGIQRGPPSAPSQENCTLTLTSHWGRMTLCVLLSLSRISRAGSVTSRVKGHIQKQISSWRNCIPLSIPESNFKDILTFEVLKKYDQNVYEYMTVLLVHKSCVWNTKVMPTCRCHTQALMNLKFEHIYSGPNTIVPLFL